MEKVEKVRQVEYDKEAEKERYQVQKSRGRDREIKVGKERGVRIAS